MEYSIPQLGVDGKLAESALPATVPLLTAGKLSPTVIPSGVSGGPQEWSWHFPGTLEVRTGLAKRVVPGAPIAPTGKVFHLVRLEAVLGTIASGTGTVRGSLMVNGSTLATFATTGYDMPVDLTALEVVTSDQLSVDITEVPTPSGGTVYAGDLTVQIWWEWA